MPARLLTLCALCALCLLLSLLPATGYRQTVHAAGPTFIQASAIRVTTGTSASVTLANVTAGDTLVAYTISDAGMALAVSDGHGAYPSAHGPLLWNGTRAVQVFSAVAAGGSTIVTATANRSLTHSLLLYVHEYAGVGSLDAATGTAGTGATPSSGTLSTSQAGDLLFGAVVSDNSVTAGSAGFNTRSVLSGNLTEDKVAGAAGSYSATASHNGTAWAMELVAFKPAGAPPVPTATSTAAAIPTSTATGQPSATPTIPPTATLTPTAPPTVAPGTLYPLRVSGRHLVDATGTPFLLVGDSPHDLIGRVSLADAATYFAAAQAYGINAGAVYLLCNGGTGCNADGTTYDGIAPFTTPGDLATPNEAYFARVGAMIRLAAQYGIVVLLDPIETTGWLGTLQSNGTTKDFNYGVYLGNRYKSFPNILWYHGDDFQTWNNASDRADVQAVANGIRSVDTVHIHTAELNYYGSDTWQDASWLPLAALDGVYSYYPTYDEALTAYNRNSGPTLLLEANYEDGGQNGNVGTLNVLRRQEYWTMLSGAAGQLYGNYHTRHFDAGWLNYLNPPGETQLGYLTYLLAGRPWWMLVPDQGHALVTAGTGTYTGAGLVKDSDYATAALASDGSQALVYLPTIRTISVAMSRFSAPVLARWYDPTNGVYTTDTGLLLPNSGTAQFTPPGTNSGGDPDWILALDTQASPPTLVPTSTPTNTPIPPTATPVPPTATATQAPIAFTNRPCTVQLDPGGPFVTLTACTGTGQP